MDKVKPVILLVVDYGINYYNVFKGAKLNNGTPIKVEQTRWKYVHAEATTEGGATVHLKQHVYPDEPWEFSSQKHDRTVKPDFALIRNFPLDSHGNSFKSHVLALKIADLPAVNSIDSVYLSMDRAYQYAELLKVQKRLIKNGKSAFDLVPMTYISNERIRLSVPESPLDKEHVTPFPLVVKVGSAHAGRGKLRVKNSEDMKDVEGILALGTEFFTTEPLLNVDYEYRIQKIGNHFRAFIRQSDAWKQSYGNLTYKPLPLTETHVLWATECSKMMGGLDILGLDIIHTKEGKDVVLEINDCAIGLVFEFEDEDVQHIKELVLQRMNEHFCPERQ